MVKIDKSDSQKAIVTVYAYVGSWDFNAASFQALLDELEAFPTIVIRLHTYGGTVFDGNIMFNAALASKKIEIEVVGVVASMGTIFLQGAKAGGRKMVENGFMMIHTPSGYTDGNAKQHLANAKLLQNMEKQFIKVYGQHQNAKPNGTAKYLDGTDHWLSAEEALAEGLIDGIIPSVVDGPQELTVEAVAQLGPKAVFDKFKASLKDDATPPDPSPENLNKHFKMKQALIDKYGLKGVTADSTDAEVQAALDAHFEAIETKAKNDAEAVKKTTVEAMVKAQVGKKITAQQEATFVAIGLNAGVDALQEAFNAIKPSATIAQVLNGTTGKAVDPTAKNREGWDWDKYQAEAPADLEKMEVEDPENFKALFKAKYGVEPKSK
ncbi:Clp protease ClpP [Pelobium manganitolerans]|uniref:Clp protease ClpP n=1 Tax=Pelobium manganitolerans TaxID=1842495 RepID=UPI003FA3B351